MRVSLEVAAGQGDLNHHFLQFALSELPRPALFFRHAED
jgi:hypothetical protein